MEEEKLEEESLDWFSGQETPPTISCRAPPFDTKPSATWPLLWE